MRILTIILLFFSLAGFSQSVHIDGPTGKVSDLTAVTSAEGTDPIIIGDGTETIIRDSLYSRGVLYASRIQIDSSWHIFGGFADSAVSIDITEDEYSPVTNASNNLWIGLEAVGFSVSGDTMIIDNAGDYFGSFSVTWTGGTGRVYRFRVYNVTDGAEEGFSIAGTGDGADDYVTITKPLYFEDVSPGDRFVMQVTNIDNSEDITIRYGAYTLMYLHE